ncbi:fibronectin type III domain-containing protein [Populibacterium corticicola]|uniref:Fibronectin type III domain-containing protein n=1 Tax=Populibacterium corticicola TaxID=1812826 RepID=A0ABW5XHQ7_9MICO
MSTHSGTKHHRRKVLAALATATVTLTTLCVPAQAVSTHAVTTPAHASGINTLALAPSGAAFTARVSPGVAAKKAKKTRKVLIVPVYWKGAKKPKNDVSATKKHVKKADAYFNEVSGGKVRLTVSKTLKWQKIKKPAGAGCTASVYGISKSLSGILKKNKIKRSSYDHMIVRLPSNSCKSKKLASGEAELGGKVAVMAGPTDAYVLTHEIGHNLRLPHGNSLLCSKGKVTLTSLKKCNSREYGDYSDVMGHGDFSYLPGPQLDRVGWLKASQKRTFNTTKKKTSKSYSLRAITSKKSGVKAVRVKVNSKRSYWVEYRDGKNGKTALSGYATGVQIRLVDTSLKSYGAVAPVVLDVRPGGRNTNDALAAGESWRSPEGIRFAFSKVSGGKANVKVQTKASVAKKPKAPTKLGISSADSALKVKFTRPSSAGAPVAKYQVEYREVGKKSKSMTVDATHVKSPTVTVSGLKEKTAYQVRVRAWNQKGWGSWTSWKKASTADLAPSLEIEDPKATLTSDGNGYITLYVKAQPNKFSKAPIAWVVAGSDNKVNYGAWTEEWLTDVKHLGNGRYQIKLRVWNYSGNAHTASVKITATTSDNWGRQNTASRNVSISFKAWENYQ